MGNSEATVILLQHLVDVADDMGKGRLAKQIKGEISDDELKANVIVETSIRGVVSVPLVDSSL